VKIILQTDTGEFVQNAEIPEFIMGAPKVIGWGDRVFELQVIEESQPETGIIYREVFALALVPDNLRDVAFNPLP
jgi:hypothetical protein